MGIVDTFINTLPYSLLLLAIPVIGGYLLLPKGAEKEINNRVEIFLRGNTKTTIPCTVNNDMVQFSLGETEYNEPITSNPRIEYEGGQVYRTFLYAEGITGTIDIPPLTKQMRDKIVEILVENKLIDSKKTPPETITDEELFGIVSYYQFDIEIMSEKPMMKEFNSSLNHFVNLSNEIMKGIKRDEGGSKWGMVIISFIMLVLGIAIGSLLEVKGVW